MNKVIMGQICLHSVVQATEQNSCNKKIVGGSLSEHVSCN